MVRNRQSPVYRVGDERYVCFDPAQWQSINVLLLVAHNAQSYSALSPCMHDMHAQIMPECACLDCNLQVIQLAPSSPLICTCARCHSDFERGVARRVGSGR